MADYGITISANGTTANGSTPTDKILLSGKYPFEKLDSTNLVSFQNISLFFSHEPPTPPVPSSGAANTNKTLVYTFNHGYTYTPRWWVLIKNNSASPPALFGYDRLLLANGIFADTNAVLTVEVTPTAMNFYVNKSVGATETVMPNVAGKSLMIRTYIFVDQLPLS